MSEIIEAAPTAIISFYSIRAQQNALASQYVTARVLAAGFSLLDDILDTGGNDIAPRTITLELLGHNPTSSNTTGPADASGLKTIGGTSALITLAQITFDIGKTADAYMQTFDISFAARQTVHQTAVGFYVDEFNEGVGQLTLEAQVTYNKPGTTPAAQVQGFFNLLHMAKLTNPLADAPPCVLRYHDSYLGLSLLITQDSVHFKADVEKPNCGLLGIAATILYDYSNPAPLAKAGSILPTDAAQVTASLAGLGDFDGTTIVPT